MYFWLKDNCFTILCWFLPYISMNCHMYPPSWTSITRPTASHPRLSWSPSVSFLSHIASSHWLSILHMVGCMFPLPLSSSVPPSPPLLQCVHKSVLYVCIYISALKIGSSVPSFWIPYKWVYIYIYIYFWLTSFCIIGSRFIHLIITDTNVFLFMTE